jgi:hypothetical protein
MTHLDRYALNFAKVAYHTDDVSVLDNADWYHIHRIFNHFPPQYHDQLAEYPLCAFKNITPRDIRRCKQYEREGEWPIFMFSLKRIETYLDRLKQA